MLPTLPLSLGEPGRYHITILPARGTSQTSDNRLHTCKHLGTRTSARVLRREGVCRVARMHRSGQVLGNHQLGLARVSTRQPSNDLLDI